MWRLASGVSLSTTHIPCLPVPRRVNFPHMPDVFVVAAVRSAIGRFGGAFRDLAPPELAAPVMAAALERAGVAGQDLDLVVMGHVLRGGHGQLVPRQAALAAGIPKQVDALAVDMVCSSGMAAVMTAASQIRAGEVDMVLAGGMETMSSTGFFQDSGTRWGRKYAPDGLLMLDLMARDGLSDPRFRRGDGGANGAADQRGRGHPT